MGDRALSRGVLRAARRSSHILIQIHPARIPNRIPLRPPAQRWTVRAIANGGISNTRITTVTTGSQAAR